MKQGILRLLSLAMVLALLLSFAGLAEEVPVVDEALSVDSADPEGFEVEEAADEAAPVEEVGEVDLAQLGEPAMSSASGDEAAIPAVLALGVGQEYALDVSALADGGEVSFSSSKEAVASVSADGVVTALKKGKAVVTIDAGEQGQTRCEVRVSAAPKKVSFAEKSVSLHVGDALKLEPVITKGSRAGFTWSSKDAGIATVDAEGTVTGMSAGQTTVVVRTHNGKKASVKVQVAKAQDAPLEDEEFNTSLISMIRTYEGRTGVKGNGSGEFASGRLIVKAKALPDLSAWSVADMIRDDDDHYIIQFYSEQDAEDCAAFLETAPGVVYVDPDRRVQLASEEGVTPNANSWGVAATHANAYAADLRRRKRTRKVIVAVIDSGIDSYHPIFSGRLVSGYDFEDDDSRPQDGAGHGTHVAGTIVDCTPGLNVKIMPIRVLDNDGAGYNSVIATGIKWAVKKKASVINLSLGTGDSRYPYQDRRDHYEDEVVANAVKSGVVVVAAAGNESTDTKLISPAGVTKCITVSAVDQYMDFASFSNYGSSVDICAPGVSIYSSVPGYDYESWSGTSMAAPHVSAAAAMLLCDDASLSPAQVEKRLRKAATDLGPSGWDRRYGAGFLNLKPLVRTFVVKYKVTKGTGGPTRQIKKKGRTLTISRIRPKLSYTVKFNYGTGRTGSRKVYAPFKGWNTKSNGKGTSYAPGSKYKKNAGMTLYAQWKPAKLGTLPKPTRAGYTFVGWFTAASGGTRVSATTQVKSNRTVYAHWKRN